MMDNTILWVKEAFLKLLKRKYLQIPRNQYNNSIGFFFLVFFLHDLTAMGNVRLQTLLARSPLSAEDRHNIAVIFAALTSDKQHHILENWDIYIVEMVMVRKEINGANRALLEEAIEMIDTLKDAKNAQEAEMLLEKFKKQKQTRLELDSVHKYHQVGKLNLIRSIAQIPD